MGNMLAAKESFATARRVAASCRDGKQKKAELYKLIAKAQARVRDIVGAEATAAKIRRGQERFQAYLAIAREQEEMGDIAAAKKSLWQARAAVGKIRGVDNKVFGYLAIAKEQARIGDMTGAKVVRHSRYVIFQMAEVAVPRTLFREILDRISCLAMVAIAAGADLRQLQL